MTTARRFVLLALTSSVFLSNNNVHGFVVVNNGNVASSSIGARPTTTATTRPVSWLAAKASKTKKSKSKASGGGGGGFGVQSKTPDKNTQVRSVSGHTGSGTKPLRVAANTFDQLQKEFGPESVNDIYVRSVLNDPETFWFVGKTARALTCENIVPTTVMAVLSQKRLILEYAIHQLRPQNFGGKFSSSLELWIAPGNSEMEVVQNKITLEKVEGSVSDLLPGFHISTVGFNPEIYVGEEVQKGGLRVKRNDRGEPLKGEFEVNLSA